MAHHPRNIILFYDEADVDFGCALGNHSDINLGLSHGVKDAGGNARGGNARGGGARARGGRQ